MTKPTLNLCRKSGDGRNYVKHRKSSKNVVATVTEALKPVINELGYSVWDIEYVKEGADYFLRFTIDHADGVDILACEKVHRTIDPLLDELDPIEEAYHLEVSSPGVERDVKYDWHYEVLIGAKLELRLFAPIEAFPGKKSIVGILKGYEDGVITLEVDGEDVTVPHDAVAKAKTVYDF